MKQKIPSSATGQSAPEGRDSAGSPPTTQLHDNSTGISFAEFVAIIALLMALNALAIDVMLPALPEIGDALSILEENKRQTVLTAYLIGFGGAQLFIGPITDAFGRRKVLLGGLVLYCLGSLAAIYSQDLNQLLLARLLQGIGCAAARVTALSVVRDCYTGRQMGKVMSLAMMVFMSVPVIAPSIGQAIVLVADWHWIFAMLLIAGLIMLVWAALRLPETLPATRRRPIVLSSVMAAYGKTLKTRVTLGYTFGLTFMFGGLFAFLGMSQQIFVDVFGLGNYFPLVFAGIAVAMAASSFVNSQLVEAFGMRRLSHVAAVVSTSLGAIIYASASLGAETLWLFLALVTAIMASIGFLTANFNAMAIEPLGEIAGTASSVIGFISTFGGGMLGYLMGQLFDGSTQPLGLAYAVFGLCTIGCILFAEGGRMFNAHERNG